MNQKEYEIYNVEAEMFRCNKYFPNCIGFQLNWEANVGFGELEFMYDTSTKDWSYDSECMGKEFAKAVLDKWLEDVDRKTKARIGKETGENNASELL